MTTSHKPVGIGIIGMGFMGQTHARAYLGAIADGHRAGLVAVCDRNADRRSGVASGAGNIGGGGADRIFEAGAVSGYADADALLADESVDLVSICTPTHTHAELAVRALDAGKHVLVEKPVAIRTEEIERVADAAARNDRLCVPAMCMRHWPGWRELKRAVVSGEHGGVRHARFDRLGSMPAWGTGFYNDPERSGGAVFDLHVHDADAALWLFGRPERVSSAGDHMHIASQYCYADGPGVSAQGGWLADPSFPFTMRYLVEFERAVMTFDINAEQPVTLHKDGEATHPTLDAGTGYDLQARAVIDAALAGDPAGLPTLRDALDVTRLILAERQSAGERRSVAIDW